MFVDFQDQKVDSDEMTIHTELSPVDAKHVVKRMLGEALSFEKMNPDNLTIN